MKEEMNKLERVKELKEGCDREFYTNNKCEKNCLCPECIESIRELLEETKKGCGGKEYNTGFKHRTVGTFCNKLVKCSYCQEIIKICKEIL